MWFRQNQQFSDFVLLSILKNHDHTNLLWQSAPVLSGKHKNVSVLDKENRMALSSGGLKCEQPNQKRQRIGENFFNFGLIEIDQKQNSF